MGVVFGRFLVREDLFSCENACFSGLETLRYRSRNMRVVLALVIFEVQSGMTDSRQDSVAHAVQKKSEQATYGGEDGEKPYLNTRTFQPFGSCGRCRLSFPKEASHRVLIAFSFGRDERATSQAQTI